MDIRTRDLRNVCEPIGANVYFAPEAHERYRALGLEGYGSGYFCSRGASLGKPSGLVVTSAFGVFSPGAGSRCRMGEGGARTAAARALRGRGGIAAAAVG
jgi:hypothetical protein